MFPKESSLRLMVWIYTITVLLLRLTSKFSFSFHSFCTIFLFERICCFGRVFQTKRSGCSLFTSYCLWKVYRRKEWSLVRTTIGEEEGGEGGVLLFSPSRLPNSQLSCTRVTSWLSFREQDTLTFVVVLASAEDNWRWSNAFACPSKKPLFRETWTL